MRPPEVLDQQAWFVDSLQTQRFWSWLRGMIKDDMEQGRYGIPEHQVDQETTDQLDRLRNSVEVSQAFHVHNEMVPLVRAAAIDLDELDHLSHEVLPAEHGFLMFDEAVDLVDLGGGPVSVRCIQWAHGSGNLEGTWAPGIWLTQYDDAGGYVANFVNRNPDLDRRAVEQYVRELGPLVLHRIWFQAYGHPVGAATGPSAAQYAAMLDPEHPGSEVSEDADNIHRIVVALFRLLGQTVVEVRDEKPDRATARRATRKSLTPQVRTIRLRRKEYVGAAPESDRSVEWQHSWIVRGHWAWRACGEEHVSAEPYEKGHRTRVYIAPYVKGPEDRPLQIGDKVWSLAR